MIVVDASVVYKWIIDEDEKSTRIARTLRDEHFRGKNQTIAPDILLYEIGNIFAFKTKLSTSDAMLAWKNFLLSDIAFVSVLPSFMTDCVRFSKIHGVSVYDASYILLAKKKKCIFVTADAKLVSRVSLPFVRSLLSYQ